MKCRLFSVALAASLLYSTTGCSFFAPKHEKVVFDSEPQGATIIIPGQPRSTTPAALELPCDEDFTVVFRKAGYCTQSHSVRRTLGKCGIMDVVGTVVFLLPAFGLLSPGAYTLEHHTIFAPLVPEGPSPSVGGDGK